MDVVFSKLGRAGALSDAEKSAFESAFSASRTYAPGQDVIAAGETASFVGALIDGNLCRQITLNDGVCQILALPLPGDTVEMHSPLVSRMDHAVTALNRCTLAVASVNAFAALAAAHPRLGALFRRNVAVEASVSRQWVSNVGSRAAYGRIAHLFCEIFSRMADAGLTRGASCTLPLTQSRLAEMGGLSIVHVNRVLQRLRREDLISLRASELAIRDWESLKTAGEFNDAYLHHYESHHPPTAPQAHGGVTGHAKGVRPPGGAMPWLRAGALPVGLA